ncbi:helix-turn-helix transcriptional regulator [Sanguibacter sp. A247]|uniref:helix-turn-helix transcriptional regulator n=1 Tax=unclassified Sanguibacter TaxID=2645534 RepID=UPI003FD82CAB
MADLLGVSRKHVSEIVNGRASISPETAVKLGRATGIAADAWLRHEALYRADLARIASERSLSASSWSLQAHP